MGNTDSSSEYIYYEYNPKRGFDQEEFLEKVTPLISDQFVQDGELTPETDNMILNVEYTDQSEEAREMFDRMGLLGLDGCKNFFLSKPMTYIEAVVHWTERDCHNQIINKYDRFPVVVDAYLTIYPKGYRIID